MKKIFSFLLVALCLSTQAYADKIVASTTLPENGKPEHVYTMVNGNGVYASPTTTPVEGDAENGLFAFYAVDGVSDAYYIYSYNGKQWLTYVKDSGYANQKGFVVLKDNKEDDDYFYLNNRSGDNYDIAPYNTNGVAGKFLNWFQGTANGANSGKTLGLWQDNSSADLGSKFLFEEVELVECIYNITVPDGVTLKIDGKEYADGSRYSTDGTLSKSAVTVIAPEGMFAVVSINDVKNTITVNVATLPVLPAVEKYENAWVYPKQQDNVGAAVMTENEGVYILSNNVLAASWMKVGNALYFAGSDAMNLVAGTEPFTVAFGGGDNVPASAMTLVDVKTETLTGNASAIGGAEHYNGVQLVANYEYTYNEAKVEIVWRAVLRDGSHYIRTEMDLTGVDDVDMFNIIPMIYNVDTKAAGSTPKVVGNTRGATIVSNKIFAGLETPMAYNTVGEATGEEDAWNLKDTKTASLTATSWTQVAAADVPKRVEEATGANYPNVLAYKMANVTLKKNQKVEIEVKYTGGNHRLNFGGADLLASNGDISAVDYHSGYSGGQHSNNTFSYIAPYDGVFSVRVFVENKSESIDASSTMTVKIYEAKEGVVVKKDVVGIQGRWSRNTTLKKNETWKVGAVVGLIAQDGTQDKENIRETQKRRSFLAYSERERAVPWRVFPHYNSWYELNINRNNAAPGQEHTNFTAEDILGVMRQWKTNYYDKYGEGIVAFVIDDGWDNYGPWTFHKGFPNEMRDMAALAKEMGAGVGAWLGPVGGYGQSGNYRRDYWKNQGGMQLSNPLYYETYLAAANNLVCQQDGVPGYQPGSDNYLFFKFDGISGQFSAVGPDAGDTGNENAEGIIRLEQYVREHMREDIFFNTTVGTWASPFWYQISDATWRQENDHDRIGNNSINRENWITYRDRLVYQNYVQNSPMCPINTLMTHGFILSEEGPPSGDSRDYNAVLRELRCAFVCGSGIVELYTNCNLMNTINDGKLWEDVAECVAWQKKNADVLPDAHWVGGSPWTGSQQQVYGWASWNDAKATLALRNGANNAQTFTFTLREALEIPANIKGAIILNKSFKVQDALQGLTEGTAIDIDQQLTVTLPASSLFAFDGMNADPSKVPFEVINVSPKNAEAIEKVTLTFNSEIVATFDANNETVMQLKKGEEVIAVTDYVADGATLVVTLAQKVTTPGDYTLVVPEGLVTRKVDGKAYSGELVVTVLVPVEIKTTNVTPTPDATVTSLSEFELTFNKEIVLVEDATAAVVLKDAEGNDVEEATCVVEGKVLKVTLENEVNRDGEYTLVIPEGVIRGKSLGDAFNGEYTFAVDVYTPRNAGSKTRNDRNITKITVNNWEYSLNSTEQSQDYLNLVDIEEPVKITVEAGAEISVVVDAAGEWINHFVYIDYYADGFNAGIEEGSNYKPVGDLVSYSFYNNGNLNSDANGWNSVGDVLNTNDQRKKPAIPAFKAPAFPGTYRMRLKQDWCNIDPAGDADGAFGDFKQNGGQIIDVLLVVTGETPKEYVVSNSTGTLSVGSNWKNTWEFTTTDDKPVALKLVTTDRANNMQANGDNDNLKLFAGTARSCTYKLEVPVGYVIESYSFDYVTSGNNAVTLTPDGGDALTSSTDKKTLNIENINQTIAQFTLSGGNFGIEVSNFIVKIKSLCAPAFNWTASTAWTDAVDLTSTFLSDNALGYGIKYIENDITITQACEVSVCYTYTGGNCALNIRGMEIVDATGNIIAGDYHEGKTGNSHTNNTYKANVVEPGTYKVRSYATFDKDNTANNTNGTITVSYAQAQKNAFIRDVTFGADYSTLYLGYKVAIPEGVEAYAVSAISNGWAIMSKIENVIPVATPVILKNVGEKTKYTFAYNSSLPVPEVGDNLLRGSIANRYVTEEAYVLFNGEDGVGLYKAEKNQKEGTAFINNANKAYLPVQTGNGAPAHSLRFDFDGTTAVEDVETENEVEIEIIFDLQGRRVNEITAGGIYIINGKKVLVK